MQKEEYKLWLKPGSTLTSAKCVLCDKAINVEYGCGAALKSHSASKAHKDNVKKVSDAEKGISSLFFRKTPAIHKQPTTDPKTSESPDTTASKSNPIEPVIDRLVSTQVSVTRAEIIWVLRVVKNHQSFRSCLGLAEDLQNMFQNNEVVSKFKLSKTKCAYLVTHGIAPYIKGNMKDNICDSPFFSVSFDESLNEGMQEQQMDVQIRYWDENSLRAVTRYWASAFQMHGDAETLSTNLSKSLEDVPRSKMHQLGMDGPNTNWKILSILQTERKNDEISPLEDIGSCGLHVISGALHTGVVKNEWPIDKVLRGMFKLLNKSPARRAEYLRTSGNSLYPEKFCPTRWVENESVAQRGIEIWDGFVKYIKEIVAQPPSKRPKDNISFDNLVKYHANPLIMVYLHLFKDVAAKLNGFLIKFQTDSPMVPF